MISAPIVLAFTAGMVATFNPCGFSLLPAYIGAFVAGDELAARTDRRVIRAVGVAAAVSIGFLIVFASAGLIIDSLTSGARQQLPWITIVVGGLLIVAGVASVAGWKPGFTVRGPRLDTGSRGAGMMVAYGATYAIASLSCTLGPFLAVTGATLAQSRVEGTVTYAAYALGMGVIILILSIASAVAHTTVADHMRRISRIAPRIGGALMILAGAYAIWYGRWELAVYNGELGTDPLIEAIEEIRLRLVLTVENIGAGRLALFAFITVVAVLLASRSHRSKTDTNVEADTEVKVNQGH